jgi:hypothetical protein
MRFVAYKHLSIEKNVSLLYLFIASILIGGASGEVKELDPFTSQERTASALSRIFSRINGSRLANVAR